MNVLIGITKNDIIQKGETMETRGKPMNVKKAKPTEEELREASRSDTIYSVRELRDLLALSGQKFGDRYDIPRITIEQWESGKRTAPVYVVKLLNRVVKEDIKYELRYGKKDK
jgi:putative transcriptional regulator